MNTTTQQHTPGPWFHDKAMSGRTDSFSITHNRRCGPDILQEAIATLHYPSSHPTQLDSAVVAEANARLIASAPELLEALKALLRNVEDCQKYIAVLKDDERFDSEGNQLFPSSPEMDRARAAIAKATEGGQ